MKLIRQSPFFAVILSTGFLFTLSAIAGKNNIYAEQEYNPLKEPVLSVVFTGINDEIYPWQIFNKNGQSSVLPETEENLQEADAENQPETDEGKLQTEGAPQEADGRQERETEPSDGGNASGGNESSGGENASDGNEPSGGENASDGNEPSGGGNVSDESEPSGGENQLTGAEADEEAMAAIMPSAAPGAALNQEAFVRPTPFRESTKEEYLNHISADIYGDVGVINAASYEFGQVDESYFDDALFIGDSRTVGLRDYTDLSEHADFMCETSLTIYKVMEEEFAGIGTIEEALNAKDYGKIYLMAGINELGRGTTEDFMAKYTEVIDTLHELEPDAIIFIQGIMRVSGKKNSEDAIFNNSNINARNNAIATLADNQQIFYIDVNEVVCDEEGNLTADYTFDQIHLLGVYNDLWKQFLLSHGVIE